MAGHKQHIQANNIGNMRKSVSTDNIGNNFIGNNVPVQSQANRTALHSTSTRISHTTQSNHDASQRFTSSPSDNQQCHQRNRIEQTQDIPSNRMRQIQQRQQFHNQENVHERAVFAADDMENINEHKQQQIRSQFITNSQQQHHVLPNNQRNGSKFE